MRNIAIGFALAAAIFAAVGVAYAAIPHSQTGVITGCVSWLGGHVRIIDTESGKECWPWENQVEWGQAAPPAAPTYYTVHNADSHLASVECDEGDIATGGGAGYVLSGVLSLDQPLIPGNVPGPATGWIGQLESGNNGNVNVWAICLDLTP